MSKNAPLPWSQVPLRFAVHVFIGVLMFGLVGFAAVALHEFVDWMAATGVATWIVNFIRFGEYALFVGDIGLFAIFTARTTLHHATHILTAEVE